MRSVARESHGTLILSKSDSVWCWGTEESARQGFGKRLGHVAAREVPADFRLPENLHVKGFIEEALTFSLIRDRPLLARMRRNNGILIVDPHAEDVGALDPLFQVVGKTSGNVPGLFTSPTPEHPEAGQVRWAEALRVSLDRKDGRLWVLIDPDIWIWPPRTRESAREFLDVRRKDRLNAKYNEILDAWKHIIMGTDERNAEITVRPFVDGSRKNPYLSYYEMQSVLSRSLEIYQTGHFGRVPKKITIHKNTPFQEQEVLGALDSFRDGTEVELVQIVRNVNWKGIQFDSAQPPKAHGFPVERGTILPVDQNEALFWTQGSVLGVNLKNPNYNVYKEGALKPTPSPVLIRRHSGAGGWHDTCSGILGLTKMDWNNNTLYKKLPVTLVYSKAFVDIIQQNPNMVDSVYDFRSFM